MRPKPLRLPSPLAIMHKHHRVAHVRDERGDGGFVVVTLKAGWTFNALADVRTCTAETPAEALRAVKAAHRYTPPADRWTEVRDALAAAQPPRN